MLAAGSTSMERDVTLAPGGYLGREEGVERLLADLRVFSAAGIERAAWGWQRHVGAPLLARFQQAERAALRALASADRSEEWGALRRRMLELTEGRGSLVAWRAEHGAVGHSAERAALGAGLALLAGPALSDDERVVLLRPMAEALPWLLPDVPPEPVE
jgi:hypothetical protein